MTKRIVEIKRVKQYANKARAIGIYINNEKVDTIKDGETKSFELDAGENDISTKIDWCKTKPLKIESEENGTIKLELGSNLSGWKLLLGIYYITFKTSEYLYLKRE
ncbi:hypothetical protein ERX46_00010 [Brumimicrobium glaciale]|uniref:Uncharacterized protein n=1 Tax=Brumimicrobium glaciale TaxID=200475 RepID=A0A4Q4KRY8_9FLAO|nr:hypothetical protein [Brumimicrobium glaciale]RYM35409.1 hypothetical protein ERX46_00010 [Brumimicrobium glaciale]